MFNNTYSIYDFLGIVLLIVLFAILYYWYLRPRLFDKLASNQTIILIIERGLLILVAIVFIYAFISLSPIVNGIIVGAILLFTKDIIVNLIHGVLLIRELHLKEGKTIMVADKKGIISRLSYTGMQLTNSADTEFIPFKKAYDLGVKEEDSNNATLITLLCDIEDEENISKLTAKIEARLFSLPFILHQYKPTYDVQDECIKINVGIENFSYKTSLINSLEETGLKIRQL